MKIFRLFAILLGALLLSACGTLQNTISDGGQDDVMLAGNDPVAYFTVGRPTPGQAGISTEHGGVTYRFVSADNLAEFRSNPDRYTPQYAGYCASGLPYALKAAIGANVFAIVDDKLYMFGSERSRRHWLMNAERNIELGDQYWESEVKDAYSRIQNIKRYVFKVDHYKTDEELEAEYQRRQAEGTLPPGI